MSSKILHLTSLAVDYLREVLDLLVDKFLVVAVDQWRKVGGEDGNEREAPKRKEFDEPVRDQRSSESLWIVSKHSLQRIIWDSRRLCASDSLRTESAETQ